jgi:hypothetical protein
MELIMCKVKASKVFEHVKFLWPSTTYIRKTPLGWQAMETHDVGRDTAVTYGSGVAIDWGTQTQYPTTVYREVTPQDAVAGATAEFSTHPDFRNPTIGTLTGWVTDHDYTWWYRKPKDGSRADACRYCRIPVPVSEQPPEGWRAVTEADKRMYSGETPDYAALMYEDGTTFRHCYWQITEQQWRASGNRDLPKPPKYIRDDRFGL